MRTAVVVPCWNGCDWLPGLVASLRAQTRPPDRVVVVDSGSTDGSRAWLASAASEIEVVSLTENRGFAVAANAGLDAVAGADAVALVNTDIELAPDWLARMVGALEGDPGAGAVAAKLLSLADPGVVDDAGNVLRRDGACEQRGRGRRDTGRWDRGGEIWGACAGAALYRREAVVQVGGFDERYGSYLEDVDLALRLRIAGWRCRYEPAVALHGGRGSSGALDPPVEWWLARNGVLLALRWFPRRWAPLVIWRQGAWLVAAARGGTLRWHLRGLLAGLRVGAAARRRLGVPPRAVLEAAVAARPWRGPRAGGHRRSVE